MKFKLKTKTILIAMLVFSNNASADEAEGLSNEQMKFLQSQSKILFSTRRQKAKKSQEAKAAISKQLEQMKEISQQASKPNAQIQQKLKALSSSKRSLEFSMAKEKILQYTPDFLGRKDRSQEQLLAEKVVAEKMGELEASIANKKFTKSHNVAKETQKKFVIRTADFSGLDPAVKTVAVDKAALYSKPNSSEALK